LGVAVNLDGARPPERFKAGNDGHDFHSIVGGSVIAAGQFLASAARKQHDSEAAWTGVSDTAAIGVESDLVRRAPGFVGHVVEEFGITSGTEQLGVDECNSMSTSLGRRMAANKVFPTACLPQAMSR
jgi:hypothetical protein